MPELVRVLGKRRPQVKGETQSLVVYPVRARKGLVPPLVLAAVVSAGARTVGEIARVTGCADRSVRRALVYLRQIGAVDVTRGRVTRWRRLRCPGAAREPVRIPVAALRGAGRAKKLALFLARWADEPRRNPRRRIRIRWRRALAAKDAAVSRSTARRARLDPAEVDRMAHVHLWSRGTPSPVQRVPKEAAAAGRADPEPEPIRWPNPGTATRIGDLLRSVVPAALGPRSDATAARGVIGRSWFDPPPDPRTWISPRQRTIAELDLGLDRNGVAAGPRYRRSRQRLACGLARRGIDAGGAGAVLERALRRDDVRDPLAWAGTVLRRLAAGRPFPGRLAVIAGRVCPGGGDREATVTHGTTGVRTGLPGFLTREPAPAWFEAGDVTVTRHTIPERFPSGFP